MGRVVFFTSPWQSGEIRGRQIAAALRDRGVDTVVDPSTLHCDDIVISIKMSLSPEIVKHVKRVIVDVIDSGGVIPWVRGNEKVEIIAIGDLSAKYLTSEIPGRKLWIIPEHHCNSEGTKVLSPRPFFAGYCGSREGFQLNPDDLARDLAPLGIRFAAFDNVKTRDEVIRFYRSIDLQICFRRDQPHAELKNPLKLANAGSFGVPTIAFPELSYDEFRIMGT
jgi:hypothetical protein